MGRAAADGARLVTGSGFQFEEASQSVGVDAAAGGHRRPLDLLGLEGDVDPMIRVATDVFEHRESAAPIADRHAVEIAVAVEIGAVEAPWPAAGAPPRRLLLESSGREPERHRHRVLVEDDQVEEAVVVLIKGMDRGARRVGHHDPRFIRRADHTGRRAPARHRRHAERAGRDEIPGAIPLRIEALERRDRPGHRERPGRDGRVAAADGKGDESELPVEEVFEPSPAGIAAEHHVDIDIPVPVEGKERSHRGPDGKLGRPRPDNKSPAPEIPPQAKRPVVTGDKIEVAIGIKVGNGRSSGRPGSGQGLGREGAECPRAGRRIEAILEDDDASFTMDHQVEIGRRATSRELLRDDLGAGLVGAGTGRGAGALRLVEVEVEIGGHDPRGPPGHVRRGEFMPRGRRAIRGGDRERHLPRGAASEHAHLARPEEDDVGEAVEIEILEKDRREGTGGSGAPHRLAAFEARFDPRHFGRLVEPRLGIELRSIAFDHELERMPLDRPSVGFRLGDEDIGQPSQPPRNPRSIATARRGHPLVEDVADVDVGERFDRRREGLHRPPTRFDLFRQAAGHLRRWPLPELEGQGATPLDHEPEIAGIELAGPVERRGRHAGAVDSVFASACLSTTGQLAERFPPLVPGRRVRGGRAHEPARGVLPSDAVTRHLGNASREPQLIGRRPLAAFHRLERPPCGIDRCRIGFQTAIPKGHRSRHGEISRRQGFAGHLIGKGRESGDALIEGLILEIPQRHVRLRHDLPRPLGAETGRRPPSAPGRSPQAPGRRPPPRHRQPHEPEGHQEREDWTGISRTLTAHASSLRQIGRGGGRIEHRAGARQPLATIPPTGPFAPCVAASSPPWPRPATPPPRAAAGEVLHRHPAQGRQSAQTHPAAGFVPIPLPGLSLARRREEHEALPRASHGFSAGASCSSISVHAFLPSPAWQSPRRACSRSKRQ